jgi:hypothetical protein
VKTENAGAIPVAISGSRIKRLARFSTDRNRLGILLWGHSGGTGGKSDPGSGADVPHAIAAPGRCPTAAPRNAPQRASYWVDPKLGSGPISPDRALGCRARPSARPRAGISFRLGLKSED